MSWPADWTGLKQSPAWRTSSIARLRGLNARASPPVVSSVPRCKFVRRLGRLFASSRWGGCARRPRPLWQNQQMTDLGEFPDDQLFALALELRKRALQGELKARGIAHALEVEIRRRMGNSTTLSAPLDTRLWRHDRGGRGGASDDAVGTWPARPAPRCAGHFSGRRLPSTDGPDKIALARHRPAGRRLPRRIRTGHQIK